MRAVAAAVLAAAVAAGCAAPLEEREPDEARPCLYEVGRPHAIGGDYQLIRGGQRVPNDDLVAAVAGVPDAEHFAARSTLDQWLGIGGLILGPVLFLPGIGVFGYGIAQHQNGTIAGGTVLSVVGGGALVAGAVLLTRSDRDRAHAIAAFNAQRGLSCRP